LDNSFCKPDTNTSPHSPDPIITGLTVTMLLTQVNTSVGSESISDTCNIHSGCFILWKLKPTHSPHSYVIQRVPISCTHRNYTYKFPTLPEVTSIDYKFSNRKWFQSQTHQPISATLLLLIQAHEHDLFVKTIAHTSPVLINAIYVTYYGKGFPTYRGLTSDNENPVLSFWF
jgi:hypothetical protein